MPKNKLVRGSHVGYVVEGEDGFRVYTGEALGHEGNFTVTRLKVTAGENYGQHPNGGYVITQGETQYFGDVPHGDVGQGGTWVWLDEIPAGFHVG